MVVDLPAEVSTAVGAASTEGEGAFMAEGADAASRHDPAVPNIFRAESTG